MSEILSAAKRGIVLYKLAILIGILFSINSLSTSILVGFQNSEWHDLSPTSRFLIVVGVIGNWSGTLMAYLSKAAHRIDSGESPINGDTQFIPKHTVDNPPPTGKG